MLWKILLIGTPHTPRKFLPFSPSHPLGISIDNLRGGGGYGYFLESHNDAIIISNHSKHDLTSFLNTLVVGLAGVWTHDLSLGRPVFSQLS